MKLFNEEVKILTVFTVIGTVTAALMGLAQTYDYCAKKWWLSDEKIKSNVCAVLSKYQSGINTHTFDAYEIFDEPVERFITMKNVSPANINAYINSSYYQEFVDPTITFDFNTLSIKHNDDNITEVEIIEDDSYFKKSKGKKERHKTKVKIIFNKDFKIRVLDLYQIIK